MKQIDLTSETKNLYKGGPIMRACVIPCWRITLDNVTQVFICAKVRQTSEKRLYTSLYQQNYKGNSRESLLLRYLHLVHPG